jgi:hypothetical protein
MKKPKILQNATVVNGVACDEDTREALDLEVEIKPHPEGAKRGGYVPTVEIKGVVWMWEEGAWDWVPYD